MNALPVIERLGWVLVHSLWQFALMALIAGIVVRALRRKSAALRYGALVCVMAISTVAPVATWLLLPQDSIPPAANADFQTEAGVEPLPDTDPIVAQLDGKRLEIPAVPTPEMVAANIPTEATYAELLAISDPIPAAAAPWSEQAAAAMRPWLFGIVAGWMIGVVLCSFRPLLGWRMLRRFKCIGVSPVSSDVQAALCRMSARLGVKRTVQVLRSTLTHVPIVVGYLRPVILLPVSLVTSLPLSQLEAILAHELAHVRRHDFVVNLLQTLIETLFFYHPAIWWMSRRIRLEREHCCDDLVVAGLGNRVEYGRALLAIEEFRGRNTVLVLGAADGSVLSRIQRLAGFGNDRTAGVFLDRWTSIIVCLACLCVVAAIVMNGTRSAVHRNQDEQPSTIGTLPDGIEVELIGVGFHPSANLAWWKPDGSELLHQPKLEGGQTVMGNSPEQAKCREFLIHVRGLPVDHSVRTDYGTSAASGSSYSNRLWVGEHAAGPFSSNTTSIRVGLTTAPFGPFVTIDATGQKPANAGIPRELQSFYDRVVPYGVEDVNGWTELLVKDAPLRDFHNEVAWELFAVDVAGKKHRNTSEAGSVSGEHRYGFNLPQRQLAGFEYRLRPYRYWVTFENVSLKPGTKTNVKVSVASALLTDTEVLAERFIAAIRQQNLPYLDEAKQQELARNLQRAVAAHIRHPLSQARRETLAAAVAATVRREFNPMEKDALYLDFQNRYQTLIWELGRALERPELTPEQTARRDVQRSWMRAEIEKLPESAKFGLSHQAELAKLQTLFDDPLNAFFQEPMSDKDFAKVQKTYAEKTGRDRSDTRLVAACNRLFQAIYEVLQDKLLQESPVENVGSHQGNLRWSLIVTRQSGNSSLHLNDRQRQVQEVYVDVMQMIFVPSDAPPDRSAHAAWLQEKSQGDLAFDARLDALLGVREAKLALLDASNWFSSDQISLAELRKLMETSGKDSVPLSKFVQFVGDPANGIQRVRADAPSIAIQTKEGRIAVIRILGIDGGAPVIGARPRPLPPNPPLHAGDVAEPDQTELQPGKGKDDETLDQQVPENTQPALRISGRVLDAETGEPIANCRMMPTSIDGDRNEHVTWQSQYLQKFTDGRFLYETDRPWEKMKLRIEADGYRPAATRIIHQEEKAVAIDVELVREVFKGIVLLPNGEPAAKAQLAIASWTNEVTVKSDRLSYGHHAGGLGRKVVETDDEGRFKLPAEIDPSVIVASHAAGYAEVTAIESATAIRARQAQEPGKEIPRNNQAIRITLQPWGRVKGRLLVQDKPVAGAKYYVYQARSDDVFVWSQNPVETDADGRFAIEKIPPGPHGICQRSVDGSDGKNSYMISGLLTRFAIPAGKTTMLELGRPGPALVGSLAAPKDFPLKVDWTKVRLNISRDSGNSWKWDDETARQTSARFDESEEGRLYSRKDIAVNADGTFRIEGLPPAEYQLRAIASGDAAITEPKPEGDLLFGIQVIRVDLINPTVPPAATTDIGIITLTAKVIVENVDAAGTKDKASSAPPHKGDEGAKSENGGSGLVPGQYAGAAQVMRIGPDGSIDYNPGLSICHMTVFEDDRIKVAFRNERQIWTDVTLPFATRLTPREGEKPSRDSWSAEIDGHLYRATAIPFSSHAYIFRLEKLLDGKLIEGSQEFFAIPPKRAPGRRDAEQDAPASDERGEIHADQSGSGLVPGRYTGARQVMQIGDEGQVAYTDRPQGICHIAVLEDGRLEAAFPDKRGIRSNVILPLATSPGHQRRASWLAEIDGCTYRATAVPYSSNVCVFRMEKLLGGKLIEGSQEFYVIEQKLKRVEP